MWHRVIEPLVTLGLRTRLVELPSCGAPPVPSVETLVAMHANAVRAVLDEEDEPVVLVGHSYGGVVITDAAVGQENVKHLVCVTSVMPERGETLVSFGESEFSPWTDPRDADGTMGVKAEPAPAVFMKDCDEEAVAGALERLIRQPGGLRASSTWGAATGEAPTGHHPILSRPELLARVLAEAAVMPNA